MRNAEDDKIRFDASALAFSYLDGIDSGIVSAGGSRLRTWLIPAARSFPALYLAIRCTVAFYRSSRQRGMARTQKIIITCAITGAIHTPSMSPYLPVTPDQITEASIGAAKAGAAILHLHARNLKTGKPDQSPAAFAAFLPRIKEATDAVVNLTSGGAPYMRIEERIQPAITFMPELASLNMGSMNFGLFPMLERFNEFQYSWERDYLESSRDLIFRNTFKDVEYALRTCAGNGTRFEFECYDIGHLYNLAHFLDRGLVQPPLFVQSVFGILGGIGTHPEDVVHMKRTADRLFGGDYRWSVLGAGRKQLSIAVLAAGMGGNIRVGLEDSLWIGPGELATSNAAQVHRARQIIEGLGFEVATPADAREALLLKGGDKVAF
jgi:uncharacterized protein (DUF849 family)